MQLKFEDTLIQDVGSKSHVITEVSLPQSSVKDKGLSQRQKQDKFLLEATESLKLENNKQALKTQVCEG